MLCIVEGHWNVLQTWASPCMVINRDNDLMWQKNMVLLLFSLITILEMGKHQKLCVHCLRDWDPINDLFLFLNELKWKLWSTWKNTSQIIKIDVNIWFLIAFINKLLMKTIAARESTTKDQSKMPIPFITVTTAIYPVSLVPFSNDCKGLLRLIFSACLQVSVQNIKKVSSKQYF